MYRICFLVCVLNTMAFEDSDEAKYIDLLPESEKQEFLNRIARRILEEIQSKDSPEESHVEVTDDQLNAHNAYVQDLIKEESENHKNERRALSEKEDNDDELKSEPLGEEEVTMQYSPQENSENRQNIDLTFRDQEEDNPSNHRRSTKDDQLNAHGSHVQDLLKEESENHKNERRALSEKEDNDDELKSELLGEDEVTTQYSPQENSVNRHNIDLTIHDQEEDNANNHKRLTYNNNQEHNENEKTDNEPSLSVIPVEVVYDKGINKNGESAGNNSSVFSTNNKDVTDSINDNSKDFMKSKTNESYVAQGKNEVSTVKNQILEKLNTFNITTSQSPEFKDSTNDVLEKDFDNSLNNMKILALGSESVLNNKPLNTESNADITNTYNKEESLPDNKMSKEKEYYDDSHTQFQTTNTMKQNILNISNTDNGLIPLTTELSLRSNPTGQDIFNEDHQISSTSIGNTTVKNITVSPKKESDKTWAEEDNIKLIPNEAEKKVILKNKNKDSKTHLRKRLQILSKESADNNKAKKYVVYEVSKETPTFIPMSDSKKYEQPYYIPIYNFKPENAYYNAHNNLGPNNDDEVKAVGRSVLNSNEDLLDKELYTRSGYEIDIEPKSRNFNYNIDKVHLNRDISFLNNVMKPKYHGVTYTPQIDLDYYFNIDDKIGFNKEHIEHKDKGAQINFKDSSQPRVFKRKHIPDLHMDYFDMFTDLRRKIKSRKAKKKGHKNYYKGKFPDSNEKDHPYNSIHKGKMKDHVRAVRNLLYLQKEFGFMSPTPYAVKAVPRHKRVFDDDLDSNNDVTTRRTSKKGINTQKISMDYYWGRLSNLNKPIDIDFDDDDLNNINSESNRLKTLNLGNTKFSISILNFLGRTAIKSDVPRSNDANFDRYLDALINMLKDMIHTNSESLVSYDWLLSTVEIRGALLKLLKLIENAENKRYIHPLDLKLLNYVVYLYDTSSKIQNDTQKSLGNNIKPRYDLEDPNKMIEYSPHITRKFITLPKSKKKKLGQKIKNPLNLWQNWYKYYVRVLKDENYRNGVIIKKFKTFLKDVEDSLYDLHITIKHIVSITTFTDQNWYEDLKRIFLKSARKKQLLQVLLHLSTCKLFDSIEESTKKGAEDYVYYVKNNREVLRRIQNEFVLVLRILEMLKRY